MGHSVTDFVIDLEVEFIFSKELKNLKESGKTVDTKILTNQLKKEKQCALELTKKNNQKSTLPQIYRRAAPSTLIIGSIYEHDQGIKDSGFSISSGFAITHEIIATNYHIFELSKLSAVGVMTSNGNVYPVIEIIASSKDDDIALVKVGIPEGDSGLIPLPLTENAPVGSRISVISHPKRHFFYFTEGIISRYAALIYSKNSYTVQMYVTADYATGSSGAPVFDEFGNVCGMVCRTISFNDDKDLQMVAKGCVPSKLILKLITNTKK